MYCDRDLCFGLLPDFQKLRRAHFQRRDNRKIIHQCLTITCFPYLCSRGDGVDLCATWYGELTHIMLGGIKLAVWVLDIVARGVRR